MTCIAAWTNGKTVWMGGDSAAIRGDERLIVATPKLLKRGEFIIGFSGLLEINQIIRSRLKIPNRPEHCSDEDYFENLFIPALQKAIASHGGLKDDDGKEQTITILIGHRGQLYEVSHLQLAIIGRHYHAIGCGEREAKTILESAPIDSDPEEIIKKALEISSRLTIGVEPPFIIERLDYVERQRQRKSNRKPKARRSARRTAAKRKVARA
jgi:ATP-dependent protease HslVU (ClpYQ) peptidase subunit